MAILRNKPATATEAVKTLQPMVYKMAHKFARNHKSNDFDDLVQNGMVGVVEAYNRYDPTAGMAFSSYAYSWIFACMNDDRRKAYKLYNNTSAKTVDDCAESHSYRVDADDLIDFNRKLDKLSGLDRSIVRARTEGYSFREISEALGKLGRTYTLHQVRNRYLEAIAD